MRHLIIITILTLSFPTSLLAASQTSGVSATVAKAQFETSQISIQEQDGTYRLTVELVNSGGLDAETVSVFVLFPDNLSYREANHSVGTISTNGSALGQFVEWQLEDIQAGEEQRLVLFFASQDEEENTLESSFSVSIVSSVSIPVIKKVAIGTDTETFSKDQDRFQRFLNACYIRYVSFKRWLSQKFES